MKPWQVYTIEDSEGFGIETLDGKEVIVSGTAIFRRNHADMIAAVPDMINALTLARDVIQDLTDGCCPIAILAALDSAKVKQ